MNCEGSGQGGHVYLFLKFWVLFIIIRCFSGFKILMCVRSICIYDVCALCVCIRACICRCTNARCLWEGQMATRGVGPWCLHCFRQGFFYVVYGCKKLEFGENKYWLTRRSYFVCIFNKFRQLNLLKVNSINESQGFKQDLLTPEPITLPPTTLILAPSMVTSKCRYKWDWSSCGLHRCWGVLSTPKIREQIWV